MPAWLQTAALQLTWLHTCDDGDLAPVCWAPLCPLQLHKPCTPRDAPNTKGLWEQWSGQWIQRTKNLAMVTSWYWRWLRGTRKGRTKQFLQDTLFNLTQTVFTEQLLYSAHSGWSQGHSDIQHRQLMVTDIWIILSEQAKAHDKEGLGYCGNTAERHITQAWEIREDFANIRHICMFLSPLYGRQK